MHVLIVFFLSGIWFFAIGTEPEFELNTAEDPYSSTEGQGKQSYLILHFQSISILAKYRIRFKCLLSVVRVILSDACSIFVAYIT
jgi:hypothetical protein